MSLVIDIGQGAGLAGATGIRPFLPPLVAGALARGDIGIDFEGTGWAFLEAPWFLLLVLAAAVLVHLAERAGTRRRELTIATTVLAVVVGALLAGGTLADSGESAVIGIVVGVLAALVAQAAVVPLLARAAARLEEGPANLLVVYADVAALVLAALAIFVAPVAFLALIAFVVLIVRGRGRDERKYAGLRILR